MLRMVLILGVLVFGTVFSTVAQQTKVDLQNQARGIDFTNAQYTKPAKTGTALPATCSTGEAFVLTTASAGANFFLCTATNTWTVQGGIAGGDVTGAVSSAKVVAIQNRAVATTTPLDGQPLTWNSGNSRWEPRNVSAASITAGGDISGQLSLAKVVAIQNRAISTATPSDGQGLAWNGTSSQWEPKSPAAPGGDLSGSQVSSATVTAIRNRNISTTAPADGQALTWNSTSSQWEPKTISSSGTAGGDITGTLAAAKVVALQNRAVASTVPTDGQTLTWNAATSVWEPKTPASGSGGSGTSTSNVLATSAAGNVLSIGAACSLSAPCNVRLGGTVYSIVSGATATLSTGTGVAYVYVSPGGGIQVGHNLTLTCSNCLSVSGMSNFPSDAVPVAMWTASNGTWVTQNDARAFLNKDRVNTSTGLTSTSGTDYQTISVDASVVGLRTSVPATATSSCVSGAWAADTSYYYVCVATNTWRRIAASSW